MSHVSRSGHVKPPNFATFREVFSAYDLLPPEEGLVLECLEAFRVHVPYSGRSSVGIRPDTPTPDDIMEEAGLCLSNWLRIAMATIECHRIEAATVENVRRSA